MSFISVLLALLIEQARPLSRGNLVHASVRAWIRWSSRNFDAGKPFHGWIAWGFAVGGPTLVSLVIYLLLDIFVSWALALVWSVAVLYASLGFRQFSFHFTQIRDALADGEEDRARELLASWRQIDVSELPRSEIVSQVIEHSVLAAHRHVFGVLAWFSVLAAFGFGPAGAVLYRLSEFVVRYWRHKSKIHFQPVSDALLQTATNAWVVIDWLPARITAISFGVVGSFEDAIDSWRNYESNHEGDNDGVVLAATAGAVNIKLGGFASGTAFPTDDSGAMPSVTVANTSNQSVPEQATELAHLAVIVGLVWRTVVLWMLLLALLTLARLLG
jgi:adenosylcobinamide-phosphate synthase